METKTIMTVDNKKKKKKSRKRFLRETRGLFIMLKQRPVKRGTNDIFISLFNTDESIMYS